MVEKFKILYVVTRCMKSGPIQVLNNIVDNLNKDIFELYLVSISDESTNRSILKEMKNKFQYMYIPINKLNAVFGRCDALKKYIEEINPDVIHSTGVIPDYIINKYYSDKQIIIAH
jgi:hypothetical protein